MKHILAPGQRDLLAQLSWSNALLGFDYDGTLAPIVSNPSRANLRAGTRRLLAELCGLYPCVVISGRSIEDLGPRLAGVPLRALVGNHGLEPWKASDAMRRQVAGWRRRLEPLLLELQGVEIEDKTYSLAIHLRRARSKKAARAGILSALEQLGQARLVGGKQVINVLPAGAPHKGLALERERERWGCDTAFFLGDDETDEDVFGMGTPGRLFSVRVGAVRGSQAAYCLRSQREIDPLLERLISLRKDGAALRRRAR